MHPEHAERAELLRELDGELPPLEPSLDVGEHPFADEPAHAVADRSLLGRQGSVEVQQIQGIDRRAHRAQA